MGVLNVTPDSFSDAGNFLESETAIAHALRMESEGAEIIDIGGESTRPGAVPVEAEEELRRIIPVIEGLRARSQVVISIDTSKAVVAEAAIALGAEIINDVTALRGDARMPEVAAKSGAGIVLMHMQGKPRTMQEKPEYKDVTAEVAEFLRQRVSVAIGYGMAAERMAIDPGIGFGKTAEHNAALLRSLFVVRRRRSWLCRRRGVIALEHQPLFQAHVVSSRTEVRLRSGGFGFAGGLGSIPSRLLGGIASRSDACVELRAFRRLLDFTCVRRAVGIEHANVTPLLLNLKRVQDIRSPAYLRFVPKRLLGKLLLRSEAADSRWRLRDRWSGFRYSV